MKIYNHNDITIRVYTNDKEYLKSEDSPYDLPDNVIIERGEDNAEGYAILYEKLIIIFFSPEDCPFEELLKVIAHELGHLIEGGFKKNPPDKQRYGKRHEQKAEHYENFVIDSYLLTKKIYEGEQ